MTTETLKRKEFIESDKKIPVIVGQKDNGELLIEDLLDINNLLSIGQIGTPRVVFTQSLVTGIAFKCSPENVKLLLIQFSGAELSIFDKLPHTKLNLPNFKIDGVVENDKEKCLYALDRLTKEAIVRYHKIKELGLKTIEEYNQKAEEKMPYIVCVVEYPHSLDERDIPVVSDYINQITDFSKETPAYTIEAYEDFIEIDENLTLEGQMCCYAKTKITSSKDQKVWAIVGNSDGFRLSVNGENVLEKDEIRLWTPYNNFTLIDLKEGENEFTVKLLRRTESLKFSLGLRIYDGNHWHRSKWCTDLK